MSEESVKEAYKKKQEARLEELKAQIQLLKARADKFGADAEITYKEQLRQLRNRREEAEERLAALRDAGLDAWVDLKSGVETALDDLQDAVKDATSRFGGSQ
jgi:chromosome segregation ATPase